MAAKQTDKRAKTEPSSAKRIGRPERALDLELAPSARSPGRLLHHANVRLRMGLVRALERAGFGLSVEGWVVLSLLWEADGLTQLEIGERVDKDRHHTSRLVDALEQQGLVARRSADGDRRLKRVALTKRGREVRPELTRVVNGYLAHTFEGIEPRDYEGFLRCLEHIIARIDQSEGEGEEGE